MELYRWAVLLDILWLKWKWLKSQKEFVNYFEGEKNISKDLAKQITVHCSKNGFKKKMALFPGCILSMHFCYLDIKNIWDSYFKF